MCFKLSLEALRPYCLGVTRVVTNYEEKTLGNNSGVNYLRKLMYKKGLTAYYNFKTFSMNPVQGVDFTSRKS